MVAGESSVSMPGTLTASRRAGLGREWWFAVFASISYPLLFSFVFDASAEILIYAFAHALLSALFMHRLVSRSLLNEGRTLRIPLVFILVNALYFSASSVKYFEPQLFPGYIADNSVRFLYSLLTLLVLWTAFEVLNRKWSVDAPPRVQVHRIHLLRVIIILILIGILQAVVFAFRQGPGAIYQIEGNLAQLAIEHTYLSTSDKLAEWLSGMYRFLLPVFLALYYKQRGSKWLIALAVTAMLAHAVISGSRAIFIIFGTGLFVSLVLLRDTGRKAFSWLIFSAPLAVALFSVGALTLSNRVSLDNREIIRWQLAYRFDLSDFAATLAQRRGLVNVDPRLFSDGIYRAVPKALMPGKFDAIVDAYTQQMNDAGLSPYVDYNDTYFSIGSQLFGGVGFVLFPVLMIGFLYFVEKYILKLFGWTQGCVVIAFMFMLYSSAESDFEGLLDTWRMMPVYVLVGLFAFRAIIKRPGPLARRARTAGTGPSGAPVRGLEP